MHLNGLKMLFESISIYSNIFERIETFLNIFKVFQPISMVFQGILRYFKRVQGNSPLFKGFQWISRDVSKDFKGFQGISRDFKGVQLKINIIIY